MTARFVLALALAASLLAEPARAKAQFFFQWPNVTSSCQPPRLRKPVPITWAKGEPPFTVWIVPVYGQPFIYDISDSYYQNGQGSTEILLQLATNMTYTVVMSDANGLGTGGSSQIQVVGESDDKSCLSWAQSRSVSLDFTFTVSGQAVQCERGFETSWTGGREYGPYNFTVIALDQSFNAYDVTLEDGVTSQSDWVLDIPSGSRFTVMMNSGQGYGRGGTAGIYEVQPGNDSDCLSYDPQPTGTWPSRVTIATMDAATLPVTHSARDPDVDSGISGGGIAGIVVGVVVFFALIGTLLFFLLKRRKRRAAQIAKRDSGPVDLADSDEAFGAATGRDMRQAGVRSRSGSQALVEPYRHAGAFSAPEGQGRITPSSEAQSIYSPGTTDSATGLTGQRGDGPIIDTNASALGTQGHEGATVVSPFLSPIDDEGRSGGPGIAEPLPSKSPIVSPTATTSQQPSLFYSQQAQAQAQAQTQSRSPPSPVSPQGTNTTYLSEQHKPSASMSTSAISPSSTYPPYAVPPHPQGMRVVNHDSPDSLPALPPGATHAHAPRRRAQDGQPTFRRHADAGRYEEEVVDLPPLYSEVPRDNGTQSPSSGEQDR